MPDVQITILQSDDRTFSTVSHCDGASWVCKKLKRVPSYDFLKKRESNIQNMVNVRANVPKYRKCLIVRLDNSPPRNKFIIFKIGVRFMRPPIKKCLALGGSAFVSRIIIIDVHKTMHIISHRKGLNGAAS